MMNATELMIGDWVRCSDPKPFRITGIETEKGTSYFKVTGNDGFDVDGGDVEPIPLTCSVLERNGFEEMMNEGEEVAKRFGRVPHPTGVWQQGLSNFDCVMYVPKDDFLRIKFMMVGQTDLRNIRFVHDLQHALRLCGIDKEVVL